MLKHVNDAIIIKIVIYKKVAFTKIDILSIMLETKCKSTLVFKTTLCHTPDE